MVTKLALIGVAILIAPALIYIYSIMMYLIFDMYNDVEPEYKRIFKMISIIIAVAIVASITFYIMK